MFQFASSARAAGHLQEEAGHNERLRATGLPAERGDDLPEHGEGHAAAEVNACMHCPDAIFQAGNPVVVYKPFPCAVPPRLGRSRSSSPISRLSRSSSPKRGESPTRAQLTNSSRHTRLISRFNDLYAVVRLEAQSLLRRYITDLEMVQRIIFVAVTVGFASVRLVGMSRVF